MNRHDFSKKEQVRQYPSYFTNSRPEPPVDRTNYDVPKLDLRYESNNIPQPESTGIVDESTRIYKE